MKIESNSLKLGNQEIEQVGTNCRERYLKFVGHVLDDQLNWEGHIEHISKKLASANFGINTSKHFLPLHIRKTIYYILSKNVTKNYGAKGLLTPKRMTYIINENSRIEKIYRKVNINTHAETILQDILK